MITNQVLIIAWEYKVVTHTVKNTTCNRCAKHKLDSLPTWFQKTCFELHNTGNIIVTQNILSAVCEKCYIKNSSTELQY